jgi:hypothetical protein
MNFDSLDCPAGQYFWAGHSVYKKNLREYKEALKLYCHKPADIKQRITAELRSIHQELSHQLNGGDWIQHFYRSFSHQCQRQGEKATPLPV